MSQNALGTERPDAAHIFFKDESFQFETVRTIGHMYSRSADLQECLRTVAAIKEGDDESWYSEWIKLANQEYQKAETFERNGHGMSAGESYWKASNYYRAAHFYIHSYQPDERCIEADKLSREAFLKAIPYQVHYSIQPIEIPYENTALPAYVVKSKQNENRKQTPLLIAQGGFDSSNEENVTWTCLSAADRGYTVLCFEGPGQGHVIMQQKLTFRPDWENVVGPVIDYALALPGVDPHKIALMSSSFGGVLGPIAASKEHRISALICNGGVYSFHDGVAATLSGRIAEKHPDISTEKLMPDVSRLNTQARWFVKNGSMVFGCKDLASLIEATKAYVCVDADKITCPTLILDPQNDQFFAGQPKRLYDKLTCPKTFAHLTKEEGGQYHCQAGAESTTSQIVLDWLDDTFAAQP
jgi:dienelactone hydrolase